MTTSWHNLRRLTHGVLIALLAASPVLAQGGNRGRDRVGGDREAVRSVVETLVENGLAVSRETDPVEKAKLFDQVASKLCERANAQAALGEAALAGKLTLHCSRVIKEGIVSNIDTVEFTEGDTRGKVADALLEGVPKHIAVLRQVLDKVPEAARPGIARAIEASQRKGQGALERLRHRGRRRHGKQAAHEAGEDAWKQKGQGRPPWAGGKKKKGEGKAFGKKDAMGTQDSDDRPGLGKGRGVKKKHSKVEKDARKGDDKQKGKSRGRGRGKGKGHRNKDEEG